MKGFAIKVAVNAVAVWVATLAVPGLTVLAGPFWGQVSTLLLVGLIFGIVNTVIKPIVKLIALPLYILTLGLITFLVNALMLALVAWISDQVGVAFSIDEFFWDAVLGSVVVTLVSLVLNLAIPSGD